MSVSKGFSHVITAELAEKRMEDEQLIEAVREFPCLWLVSSRAYKDLRAKENAWKEISQVFFYESFGLMFLISMV